eukprot:GHVT01102718.1.p1 GENE.GHVT01102718.1~~GHVT01102718.1.p1  ORF type:complete len:378 (-),score=82.73 GHVT01102718.1:429-1562(-)
METVAASVYSDGETATVGESIASSSFHDDTSLSLAAPSAEEVRFASSLSKRRGETKGKLSQPPTPSAAALGKPKSGAKMKGLIAGGLTLLGLVGAVSFAGVYFALRAPSDSSSAVTPASDSSSAVTPDAGASVPAEKALPLSKVGPLLPWEDPAVPPKKMDLPPEVSTTPTKIENDMYGSVKLGGKAKEAQSPNDLDESQIQFAYDWGDPTQDGPLSFIQPVNAEWKKLAEVFCSVHQGSTLHGLRTAAMFYMFPLPHHHWMALMGTNAPEKEKRYLDTTQKIKALPGVADFKKAYVHYKKDPEMLTRFLFYLMSDKKIPIAKAHEVEKFDLFYNTIKNNSDKLKEALSRLPGTDEEYDALVQERKKNKTKPLLYEW